MRARGDSQPEILASVREGFESGRYQAPQRPGVVYMLSSQNVVTVDDVEEIAVPFPGHLMFYAPMLTNGDIGSDGSPESPVFVVDEGSPHALMIVAVPDSADARQPVDPGPAPADEIELALSAAPASVSEGAGVFVLGDAGYVEARESANGFACLVDHRIPTSVEPQCFDEEGVRTFLPRMFKVAELRAQGTPEPEIRQAVADAFASGEFAAPSRPGVVYMLSSHNVVTVDEIAGIAVPFPPHLMFYAPEMTNADIGLDGNPDAPVFVVDEGSPHALMIVATPGHSHAHG